MRNAHNKRESNNPTREIAVVARDMETHIQEALTVLSVAEQKYGGDELSGVFALIESKILDIQGAHEEIVSLANHSRPNKKSDIHQPSKTS